MSYVEKESPHARSIVGSTHSGPVPANSDALTLRPAFPRRLPSGPARSSLVMHNIVVDGHRTTVRLEPVIWDALRDIARRQEVTVHSLVTSIDRRRTASSLSSAIRAFVVVYLSAGLRDAPSPRLAQDHQIDAGSRANSEVYALRTGK